MQKRTAGRWIGATGLVFVVLLWGSIGFAKASQVCDGLFGDLDQSGSVNVVDVQCSILSTWTAMNPGTEAPACLVGASSKPICLAMEGSPSVM